VVAFNGKNVAALRALAGAANGVVRKVTARNENIRQNVWQLVQQ
jgi:hypothetical protein